MTGAELSIPSIIDSGYKGNAITFEFALETSVGVPIEVSPTTLILLQLREQRGRNFPIIKEVSLANGLIVMTGAGRITLNLFTAAESYLLVARNLMGELCMGESDNSLIPVFTFVLNLQDSNTVPASVL